ncbi:MAG: 50S ribosomal protein L2 [bacterium]
MPTKKYRPITPGHRNRVTLDFSDLTDKKPEKKLLKSIPSLAGRSNGKISVRHRGGKSKRKYRIVDFKRNLVSTRSIVKAIEYDPNRTSHICLIQHSNGEKSYILQPKGLKVGDVIQNGSNSDIKYGNTIELQYIPVGTIVHNIELHPGKGGQLVRAAGVYATITAKNEKYVTLKLPSGEVRLILRKCLATIGQVSNSEIRNTVIGKAGINRKRGRRPKVRGSAMNPCDHPHGGGEGKAPIGLSGPVSPKGKKALGQKTRKKNVRRRDFKIILSRRK